MPDTVSTDQAQDVLETAVKSQPKNRGCRSGCRRGCLTILLLGLILAFPLWRIGCHTTPMRISHETTRALGPMTSDGKRIDYFRAYEEMYYPPEMKTDDNGYRIWVRGVGDLGKREQSVYDPKTNEHKTIEVDKEFLRRQTYEKLGLDPDVPPTISDNWNDWSIGYYLYELSKEQENEEAGDRFLQLQSLLGKPWTLDEHPELKDWVDNVAPPLDLLGEAVRKPVFRMPFVRESENSSVFQSIAPMNEVQMTRELARTIQARAGYRLGIGDIDGVIDDIITCHLLARHIGRHGTLIAYLVGIAIKGVATSIGIAENPEHLPTKEQIQRLLSELDKLPPRMTMEEAIDTERFFGLAAIQEMYYGIDPGMESGLPFNPGPYMRWAVDMNILMKNLNKGYDSLIKGNIDQKAFVETFSWNPFRYFSVRSRTEQIGNVLIGLLKPATHAAREAYRRCECFSNMQRLTLALLLYEKDHGTMPETDWREAVKPYLETPRGADAEKYFHCPTHRTEADETTYAMISGPGTQSPARENADRGTPHQILIAEVLQPQKLGQGVGRLPLEKAKFWQQDSQKPNEPRPQDFDGFGSFHAGGMNVGFRSGAVRFVSETIPQKELDKLLDGTATRFPP